MADVEVWDIIVHLAKVREREREATKSRGTDYASGGQPSSCYVEIGSLGRVPNCGATIIKV